MDERRRRRGGAGALAFTFALILVVAGSVAPAGAATLLPPGSVTAMAASSSSMQIRWTDPTGSRETGYGVERGMSNAGPFTQVAKTRRNTTSYTDAGLASGTTYFYRVRALGRRGAASAYSPVVSATTTRPADRTPP